MEKTVYIKSKLTKKLQTKGFLFVLPALIFFVVFTLAPIVYSFVLAFFSYDGIDPATFVAFKNFQLIFKLDSIFKKSFLNVGLYALMAVPLSIVVPLLYALLLNMEMKGSKVFRAIYYLPGLVSAMAAAAVFRLVFNPDIGLINTLLKGLGIQGPKWLDSSRTSMLSIVILNIWTGIGGSMIIYLAGLKGIPQNLYEAAKIDGSGSVNTFFKITLPMLAHATFFIMTMSIIGAFQLYDQVVMLTGGGPANSTITPVYAIYNRAFGENSNFGYASAQAVLLFIVIVTITIISQRFTKEGKIDG